MGTNALSEALSLADRGLRVFPLRKNKKQPAFAGWQGAATTDPDIIRGWFTGEYRDCGVGVATGDGVFVVDADGAEGIASLDVIEAVGADLGFVVATLSGGRHAYFYAPGWVPNSVKALSRFPGIDIRGQGGFVAAPGTFINGKTYTVVRDGPITEAPDWLVETVVGTRKHRAKDTAEVVVPELDTEPAIQRAIQYLKERAPEAVERSRGDDTTYRVFCAVKDFGISRDMAVLLASEHWNETKAFPPWEMEDLVAFSENAYAHGQNAIGKKSALAEFEVVEVIDRRELSRASDTEKSELIFARPHDFIDKTPPHREWVVDGAIPKRHVTLLYGDGGLGKTLLAQQLATSMALGAEWMGRRTMQGRVLCVFSEDDTDEIWRRQVDINRALSTGMPAVEGVHWWTADHVAESGCVLMNFNQQHPSGQITPFFRKLAAAVEAVKPALVILDPIANMFGGSEIDRAQVTGFVNRTLKRLCVQYDTTVLALAHPSVAGMASGSGLSGSTGWNNAVRSRLFLKPSSTDPAGDYRELESAKSNYGRRGRIALMKWSQGAFVVATGSDSDPERRADVALLAALRTLVERGDILSNSPRAGNYAVRRALALPEVDGLKREALEAALERLFRLGAVRMEDYHDEKKRTQRRMAVVGTPAHPVEDF